MEWIRSELTGFWGVWVEGSSGDSIVIRHSADKIPVNRRCFLPPLHPLKSVSSRIFPQKKLII